MPLSYPFCRVLVPLKQTVKGNKCKLGLDRAAMDGGRAWNCQPVFSIVQLQRAVGN